MHHQISQALSGKRPVFRNLYMKRLDHKLDLREEQREALEKITEKTARQFHTLRENHRKEADALFEQSIAGMKSHLSTEQAAKLDAIHTKMKKRHHRFRGPHRQGRPHHGPMDKKFHPPRGPRGPSPDCPTKKEH